MAAKVRKSGELEKALEQEGGNPIFLVDMRGNTTHVVLQIGEAKHLFDDFLRRKLQEGFDEADRGEFVEWDPEKIKSRGRDVLKQQSQKS